MADPRIDGWYRASGARATFAFRVEGGEVVECAPYGRKLIMGLQWGSAYMVLEQAGFTVSRLESDMGADGDEPGPLAPERAMRLGYLLSQIELGARSIQMGGVDDIPLAVSQIVLQAQEAHLIAAEVSREALDHIERDHHD